MQAREFLNMKTRNLIWIVYYNLKGWGQKKNRVDHYIQSQHEQEVKYWRNVLQRVVSVIKKLASRGLPFTGDNEVFGSTHSGNFMMCLELIAEYDPFLSEHIARHGNPGSGFTSYLSSKSYGRVSFIKNY